MGVSFTVQGFLYNDGMEVPNASVRILVDGTQVATTTTNINGVYSRSISINTLGSHILRAEAMGVYAETSIYIAYDPVPSYITCNAPSGANINEVFTVSGYVTDQYENPYYSGPVTVTVAGQTKTTYGNSSTGYYSTTFSIATAGTYTVRATCGSVSATDSIQIVDGGGNQPPVADAGGPYSGQVGVAILFNGSGSDDPDGVIQEYRWDPGDGTGYIYDGSPLHAYAAAGTYTVTLRVTDDEGATDSDTTTVTVTSGQGIPTIMYLSSDKYNVEVGELFTLLIQLRTEADNTPVVGKLIEVSLDGVVFATRTTNSYGNATVRDMSISQPGTYELKAEFKGD